MEERGYSVVRLLGAGSGCQSRVYEVRNQTGKVRVIKQLPWVSEVNRDNALREVKLLSSLRHPCIVSYLESFLVRSTPSMPSEDVLCLVMGRCERDLREECLRLRLEWDLANEQRTSFSAERPGFAESQVLSWLAQLCWGLQHLHSRKILHRDIKPQNVLLTHGGRRALLADFGVCGQVEHTEDFRHSIVGTPAFMSPEMLQGRPYGLKTDQWALGCVLFETMALEPPFAGQGESYASVVSAVLHSPPMQSPKGYSPELSSTIEALLSRKPHERPSNRDLLRGQLLREPFHAFIRSLEGVANAASAASASTQHRNGSSSSASASQVRGPKQLPLLSTVSAGNLAGAPGSCRGFRPHSKESRPDTATIGVLTKALQIGVQESEHGQGTSATAVLAAALAVPPGSVGLGEVNRCPPLPGWIEARDSSGVPSYGTDTPRLFPEVTPRCSSSTSDASSPFGGPGASQTLIPSLSCSLASTVKSAVGIGGRTGDTQVMRLAANSTKLGFDIDEEPYGSDFDSLSGDDNSPTRSHNNTAAAFHQPQAALQSAPADQSPARSMSDGEDHISEEVEESSNSVSERLGAGPEDTAISSLDDVGLGRGEWRQLLAEAEALLHPESEEEVVEEAKRLRMSVHSMLGGTANMEQALTFLRNRRPLGETVEADELMLQVELGDLLGDDGLQALPLLERLVELEGVGTTMRWSSGALRPIQRQPTDDMN